MEWPVLSLRSRCPLLSPGPPDPVTHPAGPWEGVWRSGKRAGGIFGDFPIPRWQPTGPAPYGLPGWGGGDPKAQETWGSQSSWRGRGHTGPAAWRAAGAGHAPWGGVACKRWRRGGRARPAADPRPGCPAGGRPTRLGACALHTHPGWRAPTASTLSQTNAVPCQPLTG